VNFYIKKTDFWDFTPWKFFLSKIIQTLHVIIDNLSAYQKSTQKTNPILRYQLQTVLLTFCLHYPPAGVFHFFFILIFFWNSQLIINKSSNFD